MPDNTGGAQLSAKIDTKKSDKHVNIMAAIRTLTTTVNSIESFYSRVANLPGDEVEKTLDAESFSLIDCLEEAPALIHQQNERLISLLKGLDKALF